jgi:hypothetical protein
LQLKVKTPLHLPLSLNDWGHFQAKAPRGQPFSEGYSVGLKSFGSSLLHHSTKELGTGSPPLLERRVESAKKKEREIICKKMCIYIYMMYM